VNRWTLDPALLALLLTSAGAYGWLLRRARRAPARRRPGLGHALLFVCGWAVLVIALVSPLDALGDRLLTAHMLQHVLVADLAPGLLLLGLRAPLLPLGLPRPALRAVARRGRLGGLWALLTHPGVALPLWTLCQWMWAWPLLFDAAADDGALHAIEHATLFYSGLLLWWIVVDPLPRERRRPRFGRLAVLGFSRAATAAVCLPLTFVPTLFYPGYADGPRPFGLSALADQQLAGASMCFLELLVFGVAFVVAFLDTLGREQRADALAETAKGTRP
jgi:cytochrome c oxidase assembly factor CtaG